MFGLTSPRKSSHRNFTLRRSTPVMQCSVGRADISLSSSGAGMLSGLNASSFSAVSSALSSATTSFVNDFFGSFKSMHESAKDHGDTIAVDLKIKPVFFVASIIIAIAVSTVMTLIYATHGVTKGYVLRDLQSQTQSLVRSNEAVTMEIAQARSLDSMMHNDILLHMRPEQSVIYLSGSSAIASK